MTTKDQNVVRNIKVADSTGSITLTVWNDVGNYIKPGDIWRLTNGQMGCWKGAMTLNVGRTGVLVKTGE